MFTRLLISACLSLTTLVSLTASTSTAAPTQATEIAGVAPRAAAVTPAPQAPIGEVRVAAANVREGSAGVYPYDLAHSRDLAAFARRLLDQVRPVPDIVLLQEALGRAGAVADAINRDPRARRAGARYAVAVSPRLASGRGDCGGARAGRYTVLRDSAILINRRTVQQVQDTGVLRTWGAWPEAGMARMGNAGYGCAEHPWAQVTVQHAGEAARPARVLSAHVAPRGPVLKTRALRQIAAAMKKHRTASPHEVSIIGGDLNLPRCAYPAGRPETAGCRIRAGHRALEDAGYTDTVRALNPRGPDGVLGVERRIDFIYAADRALTSGFDRCYRAFLVRQHRCSREAAVFATRQEFAWCEQRSLTGRTAGTCPNSRYHRYYSDHPLLHATVR